MTAENLWYSGKIFKAANRQKNGADYKYEYDIYDAGFKALHESAIVCSVAEFDRTIPAEKINAINNNKGYNEKEKQDRISEAKLTWEQNLKTMLYLDMPTTGDASETALIKFFQPIADIIDTRKQFPCARDKEKRECRMPFNSTNKYAFSVNEYRRPDSEYCVFTKGAPEKIWNLCTHIMKDGVPVEKDESWDRKFKEANEKFGKGGERVLGFAQLHLPKSDFPHGFNFNIENPNFPFKQQCFVGVVSLIDPPRDSVPFSVLKCQAAGIRVIMVTGDQPVTAAAIAKQCHIIREKTVNEIAEERGISFEDAFSLSDAIVIHGDELTKMSLEDEGLPESEQGKKLANWLTKSQIVFARTSPAQKLIIVSGCQKAGEVVAVTGDGVNDSPAIKKADIGISMGITGTDVAKDAADMVLLNDDFSSIVVGVE
jgi:sodium/potassium-transporting ATPase subunit alpha